MNAFGLNRSLFEIKGAPVRIGRAHVLPPHGAVLAVDVRYRGSEIWVAAQRHADLLRGPTKAGVTRYCITGRSLAFLPRLRQGDEARVIYEPTT